MYYGYGYGYSIWYFLLVGVSLVLGLFTQGYIRRTYAKWAQVPSSMGVSGAQVARNMLDTNGARQVGIGTIAGTLTDNYNPSDNKLYLSNDNFAGGSVASVAVACHEAGHAIQKAQGYRPMQLRTALVPVVNLASNAWMIVFILGVALGSAGGVLLNVAVALFAVSVVFQLVTLPVEFDASRRAVNYLTATGANIDSQGAKQVLTAAALTYVAAALVSVLQLLYIVSQSNRRR